MDIRNFPHPDKAGMMLLIDLDDRDPLLDLEAEALNAELSRLIREREKLSEDVRKVSRRLVFSGEAKLKAARDGS